MVLSFTAPRFHLQLVTSTSEPTGIHTIGNFVPQLPHFTFMDVVLHLPCCIPNCGSIMKMSHRIMKSVLCPHLSKCSQSVQQPPAALVVHACSLPAFSVCLFSVPLLITVFLFPFQILMSVKRTAYVVTGPLAGTFLGIIHVTNTPQQTKVNFERGGWRSQSLPISFEWR